MRSLDPIHRVCSWSPGPGRQPLEWSVRLEAAGRTWTAADASIEGYPGTPPGCTLRFKDLGLTWILQPEPDPGEGAFILRSSLANHSDKPIALGKAVLLDCPGPLGLWGAQEDVRVLAPGSGQNARSVHRLADPAAPRGSEIKLQFFNRTRREAFQAGFLTFTRVNPRVEYAFDESGGLMDVRAFCDFAGWELAPGASTETEPLRLAFGADPFAQLEQWARLAAARCVPPPSHWDRAPIGFVGGTWVDGFHSGPYEEVVLRNVRAVRRRLADFGVTYVWISIANLAGTQPGNWLNWNYTHFPSGPEALARTLRELGMTWGLWTGYFHVSADLADVVEELRDAFQKDEAGQPRATRRGWSHGDYSGRPPEERPHLYLLDPTHPKTLAFLKTVFATYRAWGARYFMTDYLGPGMLADQAPAAHYDRSLIAGVETLRRAMAAVREAAGPDTYLLASTSPTVHCAGLVDGVRTGNDFGEGRYITRYSPASYVINNPGHGRGVGIALQNQASAWYTHRVLYLNDSGNVLAVDKPIPLNEARIHAAVHALSGGPTMLGDDIDRLDEERLRLIKVTLPRPREVAFPADLFDAAFPDPPRVFLRSVRTAWGEFSVVALYNLGSAPLPMAVPLASLRLRDDADYLVWEFWNADYVGRVRGALEAVVPPLSVLVFRLVEDRHVPVLLGTDMHLLMGEMEVTQCAWDPGRKQFSGRAVRPAGETGSVFLHVPESLRLADPRGFSIARSARDDTLVVRIALEFGKGWADWCVALADRS